MKKTLRVIFLMTICGVFMLSTTQGSTKEVKRDSDYADKIELSMQPHTTRGATSTQIGNPVVEALNYQSEIELSIKNYSGSVLVEVVAPREVKQTYFEVYGSGTEVINVSNLRAGTYTIRITLETEILTGSFKIASYGR